jgi:HK97 gp10 family phage protein
VNIKVLGIEQLLKKLQKETIKEPVDEGIKKATLWTERTVKVSTPVDTGRLRSSITARILGQTGRIGTIVQYAKFVEYGTRKMEPRHVVEGSSTRIKGKGMFTYTMELLREKIKDFIDDMGKQITARFG